jgi:SAM-dependent methyltransferase
MLKSTLDLLRCPQCRGSLALLEDSGLAEVEQGSLVCRSCNADYPIKDGIPRFVPKENYADNFGVQWNLFQKTQLDSHSGRTISRDRFINYTGWTGEDLSGALVLDVGCGAGRFAEIALSLGARVIAIDYSSAIEAARHNLKGRGAIDFIQADASALPFAEGSFPFVYCLGVIQHTPSPEQTFRSLSEAVAPGGRLAVDVYPAGWKNLFFAKYWIRPLTRRLRPQTSYRLVERIFPLLYPISRAISRIPVAGHYLRYLIPVANYRGVYPLDDRQLREWALLDTFDMWSPAFDQPQTMKTMRSWFDQAGFGDVEVFHSGFFVGRGRKQSKADR